MEADNILALSCEPHWRKLKDWLEDDGISARKKIHDLRKIFGDAIVKQNGIFAESAQLRHATPRRRHSAQQKSSPRQCAAIRPISVILIFDSRFRIVLFTFCAFGTPPLNSGSRVFPCFIRLKIDNFSHCIFRERYPDLWTNKDLQGIREKKCIPSWWYNTP